MASRDDIRADLNRAREYQLSDLAELSALVEFAAEAGVSPAVNRRRRERLVFEISKREELIVSLEERLSDEPVVKPASEPRIEDTARVDETVIEAEPVTPPTSSRTEPLRTNRKRDEVCDEAPASGPFVLPFDTDELVDGVFDEVNKLIKDPKNKLIAELLRGKVKDAAKDPNKLRDGLRRAGGDSGRTGSSD